MNRPSVALAPLLTYNHRCEIAPFDLKLTHTCSQWAAANEREHKRMYFQFYFIRKRIVRVLIMIADSPDSLFIQTKAPYFYFGCDEEARDADELQRWFEDISLCGHEAIKVVLGQVVRLPMQLVHLAHLQ